MRYAQCVIRAGFLRNPFQYGGVVGGAQFCNRRQELTDLRRAMENAEKLFVYSERRLGKTSLIKHALSKLPKREYATAYVDLWATDNESSFVTATAKAIAESMGRTTAQLLDTGKRLFSRLLPNVTLDDEGKPKISFSLKSDAAPRPEIEEVLEAPAKVADHTEKKVVVIFDEVQRILEYNGDQIERRLRSTIQTHTRVSYIFMGSRKHLVQEMFLNKSRPLYRAAGHYPLGPIDTREWLPFIQEKFAAGDKPIKEEIVRAICDLTQGHPFYTQHLCHALWELAEPGAEVRANLIELAVKVLLDRES
ncbi:MAG: ATP-binding protein [Acidobacteria bacterium]|nr:ATP-binding protein [Acidobacteriota bacterium]